MARIAVIGPAIPYRGGPALVVANVYEVLSKKHEVEVFSFTRLYPQLLFPGTRQEDISGVPAKPHPVRRMIDSIQPLTWIKTARAIIDFKPDLVLVDWYQPFFGPCYAVILRMLRRKKIRIVFLAENVVSHEGRAVDKILTKSALSQSDGFIVFSESVEKSIHEWYPALPVSRATLPLFFSAESAPRQWTHEEARSSLNLSNEKVLLFFGYIRKYKGLRNLIAAFAEVAAKNPDAFLLIVGECYESEEEYRSLIAASPACDRIRWINEYVANEEVGRYYTACDVVVLPYISATQSGIVKIAFGYEKPVLATRVGGLAEEIGKWGAGQIVEADNIDALSQGINRMLAESDLSHYASGARKAKEADNFENIVPLIERYL